MHLWPSAMLRDSFKGEYLRKVEWNLQRMKSDKKHQQQQQRDSSSNEQTLLGKDGGGGAADEEAAAITSKSSVCGVLRLLGDLVMVLSCSYCCFCCGVCIDEEDML